MRGKQVILCILDGWGLADGPEYSAIAKAKTSFYDSLLEKYPSTRLRASGLAVGLPDGQMGNSEVGHMTIGSGRVIFQDLPRIGGVISRGDLGSNGVLRNLLLRLKGAGGSLHLLGLLSDGGVHSHIDHIVALAKVAAREGINVSMHAFLDGRDTPQKSALAYLENFIANTRDFPNIRIATVGGRYYAMDRDKNWDRVKRAYDVIVNGGLPSSEALGPLEVVRKSYGNGVTDEFLEPTVVNNYGGMEDGDGFLFCNFRADRARELSQALGQRGFSSFDRSRVIEFSSAAQLTEYSAEHSGYLETIFPTVKVEESLGEIISSSGLRQLRIAETEKYAHITFFFNGGVEREFEGEERILVKSPSVATYDLKPEMSCVEVSDRLLEAIESKKYSLIVVNFANPDMVGHTGNMDATVKAVEAVDRQLERLVGAARKVAGTVFVTADHGNAEKMFDVEKNQPHTAHTTNDVPFIVVKDNAPGLGLRTSGTLADVAPSVLAELGIGIPTVFSGKSLFLER